MRKLLLMPLLMIAPLGCSYFNSPEKEKSDIKFKEPKPIPGQSQIQKASKNLEFVDIQESVYISINALSYDLEKYIWLNDSYRCFPEPGKNGVWIKATRTVRGFDLELHRGDLYQAALSKLYDYPGICIYYPVMKMKFIDSK